MAGVIFVIPTFNRSGKIGLEGARVSWEQSQEETNARAERTTAQRLTAQRSKVNRFSDKIANLRSHYRLRALFTNSGSGSASVLILGPARLPLIPWILIAY